MSNTSRILIFFICFQNIFFQFEMKRGELINMDILKQNIMSNTQMIIKNIVTYLGYG